MPAGIVNGPLAAPSSSPDVAVPATVASLTVTGRVVGDYDVQHRSDVLDRVPAALHARRPRAQTGPTVPQHSQTHWSETPGALKIGTTPPRAREAYETTKNPARAGRLHNYLFVPNVDSVGLVSRAIV